jgi:hypothetical protein
VSEADPGTNVPEKTTRESICATNRGPTPLTLRSPSTFKNGPCRTRSAAIRLAIAGVTPGSESICAAVATSRSSLPPTYPARSSGALREGLRRRARTAEAVSWTAAGVDRRTLDARPPGPRRGRPALAAESATCIWCSRAGCGSVGGRPVTARATRTPAPSTAMAATKMRARCSGWIVTRATYGPRPAHQHRIVAECITPLRWPRSLRHAARDM